MIYTHNLSPVALDLGVVQIYWYGLMYLFGCCVALLLGQLRRHRLGLESQDLWDCLFWMIVGVLVGGRLGYMLFYQFGSLVTNPLSIFYIWQGGMSFHGAAIGICLGLIFFARSRRINPFDLSDFVLCTIPPGLGFGRLGNFINGELWGKPTDGSWGVIFPQSDSFLPRHPSQLYQMLLEGLVLFAIMWVFTLKPRPRMTATGLFLLCYGLMRWLVEFVRLPDPHLGYLAFGWLTMGQLLSLPMILIGLGFLIYGWQRNILPQPVRR